MPPNKQPHAGAQEGNVERSIGSARQILDITVQCCTVELFRAHGVVVAPAGTSTKTGPEGRGHFDPIGVVTFSNAKASGVLMLSLAEPVYGLLSPPVAAAGHAQNDALRELTNQLIGRIKNRLMQFQLVLRIGLPSTMREQGLRRQLAASPPLGSYAFRTLRGEVLVTLNGNFTNDALNYSGQVQIAKEGELITF